MKKIEIDLKKIVSMTAISILVVLIAFVILCAFQPLKAEASTTSPHAAEIVYGVKNYSLGKIKYYMQVNLNIDELTKDMTPTDKEANKNALALKLTTLKAKFEEKGLTVTASEDGFSLSIDIVTYSSAHNRAVLDPERDGYEVYDPKSGLKTWGFYRNIYEFSTDTVFKNIAKNQYLSLADEAINEMQGYGVTNDNFRYVYVYGTYMSQKTLSTNADRIHYDKGEKLYIHEFIMSKNEVNNKKIVLTQRTYNSTGFNITLLAIISVALAVTIFIRYWQAKNNTKKDGLGDIRIEDVQKL
ncbi:MAG TPA: hypothetical protein PKX91_01420 [Clostridia bacterium]|jgi:hypothetical protein|nr:hypothetical protein [Clostridia bacterium]